MTITSSTAVIRNATLQARVTAYGSGAKQEFWNGAKPAALGAPAGTKLATITYGTDVLQANGAAAGSITAGVLTFGGFTQNNATHVSGTPTFVRITKSDGTVCDDIDIGGSGSLQIPFTGTIVANQNITGTLTMTAGNP